MDVSSFTIQARYAPLSYQTELLHFPYMCLFHPVRPNTVMYTLRILYQIATPKPEIVLNLLRYVRTLNPSYEVTYPDQPTCADESVLRQGTDDGHADHGSRE